jgi:glutamate--cysteine ligase catalytic subunit
MEIQFTDFENAAFCVFIVLATKAIVSFKLNFYIPMSKNEENMQVAQRRDAVLKEKFYFRNYVFDDSGKPCSCDTPPASPLASPHDARISRDPEQEFGSADARHVSYANKMREILKSDNNESFEKKSINEIINGKKLSGTSVSTPGLADIIDAYLDNMNLEPELKLKLSSYIGFVRKRASGELITPAAWIRKFVRGHPEYKFDSKINEQINYDLLWEISKIAKGKHYPEELYGDFLKARGNQ